MIKSVVHPKRAPAAIGSDSQAIQVSALLFCSDQSALDPKGGTFIGGEAEAQPRRGWANPSEVVAAAGATWTDVGWAMSYLTALEDFAVVSRGNGEQAGPVPPARTTVQVAALPKGASVEIDAIAHRGAVN